MSKGGLGSAMTGCSRVQLITNEWRVAHNRVELRECAREFARPLYCEEVLIQQVSVEALGFESTSSPDK